MAGKEARASGLSFRLGLPVHTVLSLSCQDVLLYITIDHGGQAAITYR